MHRERMERVRAAMAAQGVDVLLLSVGPDLPWLVGYEAMPLERLTMLVVPRSGDATLVVPGLEAPRVVERPDVFGLRPWGEVEDPIALVAGLVGPAGTVAVGDRTWSRFLLDLQTEVGGGTRWQRAAPLVGPLRARKDPHEVAALRDAAEAADRVAAQLQSGEIRLAGRTEAEVSAEIGRRLVDEGHQRVNFAIVGTGANAASPHHEAGSTVIARGDVLLCDFGGTWPTDSGAGYCSDITRCVAVGEPAPEVAEAYAVLQAAQAASVAAARVGATCEAVDAAAREPIAAAGYGDRFIHRTGHGIGVEEHEDPYIVEGNRAPLEPGHAFSVEPGIYTPGAWGLRIEDIVVATEAGPLPLNRADHALLVVDA
jgi:Xaa-Pro aminopeptidase